MSIRFKKYLQPEHLGRIIYERLRSGLEDETSAISIKRLAETFSSGPDLFHEQSPGEIIIAVMFAGVMAIERSTTPIIAHRITGGMKGEFLSHLTQQGAGDIQVAEWEAMLAGRFLQYRKGIDGYSGYEPPWKLGREFFWKMSDRQDYDALSIKIATLYLLEARDIVQQLLNVEGPYLLAGGDTGGRDPG